MLAECDPLLIDDLKRLKSWNLIRSWTEYTLVAVTRLEDNHDTRTQRFEKNLSCAAPRTRGDWGQRFRRLPQLYILLYCYVFKNWYTAKVEETTHCE